MAKKEVVKKWVEKRVNGVDIAFYPVKHTYNKIIDGKPERKSILSVTGITGIIDKSGPLMYWQERVTKEFLLDALKRGWAFTEELILEAVTVHSKKKTEAADFGTMVHDWAEQFGKSEMGEGDRPNIEDEWPDEVKNGINAFVDWWRERNIKFESLETVVGFKSDDGELDYIGTFDAVARVNGKRVLIDYKTSNGVYDTHKIQACGYAIAHEQEFGKEFDQIMILHFDKKTGEFTSHVLTQEEEEKYRRAFMHCLEIKKILR